MISIVPINTSNAFLNAAPKMQKPCFKGCTVSFDKTKNNSYTYVSYPHSFITDIKGKQIAKKAEKLVSQDIFFGAGDQPSYKRIERLFNRGQKALDKLNETNLSKYDDGNITIFVKKTGNGEDFDKIREYQKGLLKREYTVGKTGRSIIAVEEEDKDSFSWDAGSHVRIIPAKDHGYTIIHDFAFDSLENDGSKGRSPAFVVTVDKNGNITDEKTECTTMSDLKFNRVLTAETDVHYENGVPVRLLKDVKYENGTTTAKQALYYTPEGNISRIDTNVVFDKDTYSAKERYIYSQRPEDNSALRSYDKDYHSTKTNDGEKEGWKQHIEYGKNNQVLYSSKL